MNMKSPLLLAVIASLTLGLAPFHEPHIIGKIKWVMGGAVGMKAMDWFDLCLHGAPWVFLLVILIRTVYTSLKSRSNSNEF